MLQPHSLPRYFRACVYTRAWQISRCDIANSLLRLESVNERHIAMQFSTAKPLRAQIYGVLHEEVTKEKASRVTARSWCTRRHIAPCYTTYSVTCVHVNAEESWLHVHLYLSRLACRLICKTLTSLFPTRTQRLHEVTKPVFEPPSGDERGCKGKGRVAMRGRGTRRKAACMQGGRKKGRTVIKGPVGMVGLYLAHECSRYETRVALN